MKSRGAFAGVLVVIAACGQTRGDDDAGPVDASSEQSALDAKSEASLDASMDADAALDAASDGVADAIVEASIDAGACTAYMSMGPYGCNKLVTPSTSAQVACVSEPAATGGTIVDGYYELTGYEFDTNTFDAACPTSLKRSGIVMFCSGTMLWFDIDQNQSSFDSTGTYTTNGNKITITPLSGCDGNKDTYDYTATSTTFEIRGGSPITFVYRYTLK